MMNASPVHTNCAGRTDTVSLSSTGSVWSLSAVAVLSIAPAVTSAAVTT